MLEEMIELILDFIGAFVLTVIIGVLGLLACFTSVSIVLKILEML